MKGILFNRWNLLALLLLLAIFSAGTYWIRQKMLRQSDQVTQSLIHGSTKGYHKFLQQYFDRYSRVLTQLDHSWPGSDPAESTIEGELRTLLMADSAIVAIGVLDHHQLWAIQTDSMVAPLPDMRGLLQPDQITKRNGHVYQERYLFLGGPMAKNLHSWRGILVDLHQLHQHFIRNNIYTSIYQVVINQNQQCIYHPDIALVGKHYPLPDGFIVDGHFNPKLFDSLHVTQSDYLQLPVFNEYNQLLFMGQAWIVMSISPGFEVNDMIAEQERNMILLFLLFLFLLIGIMVFGIMRWKREFLLRASYEQEHLNLQLKHEKQKSETISIKLELLRSGLNSHFMFNSLGTVKALLSKQDEKARSMLSDLSQLYRYQLRIEGEPMVTLQEELNFTQTYVDVINLRMNSSIIMETNNLGEYLDYKVLPVSLQVLVENCIKHNVASEFHPLVISIEVRDGHIVVDNELRPKVAVVETSGKGLQNLNARYLLLTQKACTFKKENGRYIATMPIINV
ncbi:MAG: sensor histidine kinase [Breznakibacter sp.]